MIIFFILFVLILTAGFIVFNLASLMIIILGYLGYEIQPYCVYHYHLVWLIYFIYSLIALKFASIYVINIIQEAYVLYKDGTIKQCLEEDRKWFKESIIYKLIILITKFIHQLLTVLLEFIRSEDFMLKLFVTILFILIVYINYFY